LPSVEQSLNDLQLDTIDVLVVHWSLEGGDFKTSLKLLDEAADEGLATIRHIGVSNYTAQKMR